MWLKGVFATALLAFEVAIVKLSLAASIHDCWNPDKLNRMKFPISQREPSHFFNYLPTCIDCDPPINEIIVFLFM